jgi:hypothetical protein
MTYKDVLSDLTNLLDRHKMIQTWGYGNLSDLVTPFKKEDKTGNGTTVYDIDYPYAFLQPLQHSLQKGKVTYNFNLIMMEQCENESQPIINAQSNCQQYIQDVLAEIYYNFEQKYDFTLNSSLTPFKEKYDDTVSGMTANISMEVPMILNDCIAPFDPIIPPPPTGDLALHVEMITEQLFRPDVAQSPFRFEDVIIDVQNGWRPPTGSNFFTPATSGTWTWVLEGTTRLVIDQGDWPNDPEMIFQDNRPFLQPTTSTWPTEQPLAGASVPFRVEWEGLAYTADGSYMAWNFVNEPQPEDTFYIEVGTTLKGYFTPN